MSIEQIEKNIEEKCKLAGVIISTKDFRNYHTIGILSSGVVTIVKERYGTLRTITTDEWEEIDDLKLLVLERTKRCIPSRAELRTDKGFKRAFETIKGHFSFHPNKPIWIWAEDEYYVVSVIEPDPSKLAWGTMANLYASCEEIVRSIASTKKEL